MSIDIAESFGLVDEIMSSGGMTSLVLSPYIIGCSNCTCHVKMLLIWVILEVQKVQLYKAVTSSCVVYLDINVTHLVLRCYCEL